MQKRITFWVVAFHAAVIIALLFSPVRKIHHPTKHVSVRMISTQPVERTAGGAVTKSTPTKPSPSKKPAPKQTEKKNGAAAQPKPKAPSPKMGKPNVIEKGKTKPKPPPVPKNLVEEFESAVTKIEEKRGKVYSNPKLEIPRLEAPVHTDASFPAGFNEPSYQETLAAYLHQALNLPEYGEVKIQLTLNKDGTVAKLSVLKAESSRNKTYLEKNLPLLKFPSLEKEETFVFTFCNEL